MCWCVRVRVNTYAALQCDCADDGEIGAGAKLSHLLDVMHAANVIVVVTRWYGGVHLGADRWRLINECARRYAGDGARTHVCSLLAEHGFDTRTAPPPAAAANRTKDRRK